MLGIFYGHPGVFVSPSRRALSIARKEGYEAKMLPGISSEDYMFADLEFDPAVHGCCAYEATQLLLREVALDTAMSNIIWQVGGVGVSKIDFEVRVAHEVPNASDVSNIALLEFQSQASSRQVGEGFWS